MRSVAAVVQGPHSAHVSPTQGSYRRFILQEVQPARLSYRTTQRLKENHLRCFPEHACSCVCLRRNIPSGTATKEVCVRPGALAAALAASLATLAAAPGALFTRLSPPTHGAPLNYYTWWSSCQIFFITTSSPGARGIWWPRRCGYLRASLPYPHMPYASSSWDNSAEAYPIVL